LGLPGHPTDNKWWEYLVTNSANTPGRILKLYKNRCGVKSPYRKVGEFLPKTTQRSHAVGVFYFTLAALSTTCGVILKAHEATHQSHKAETGIPRDTLPTPNPIQQKTFQWGNQNA
jgi:hypothetical protein